MKLFAMKCILMPLSLVEWSEVYTLFKLLADQTLYARDGQINQTANLFYPIIKISRQEVGRDYEFVPGQSDIVVALGMKPATVWTGVVDVTGGYLVVKEDGDILCYHIYNKNEFEDYLINTSFVDTPSSGKHKFRIVENVDELQSLKLNLQIRFL